MKRIFTALALSIACLSLMPGCASQQAGDNEDFAAAEDATAISDGASDTAASNSEENPDEINLDEASPQENNQQAQEPAPEPAPEPQPEPQIQEQAQTPPPAETLPPVQEPEPAPAPEPTPSAINNLVQIKDLQFKGNETGGTLVIEASGPFTYTTRSNPELKQFIVEIPNSILPAKLKRPLNTRDFKGGVGSIDAYQGPGSNVSRFVLQMRDGAQDPVLQMEGSSLLVATNDTALPPSVQDVGATAPSEPPQVDIGSPQSSMGDQSIMSNLHIEDFIAGNTKFYGKKVSCSYENVDTKEALEFIMLDSGLNLIIDDLQGVGPVNIRVREVPWDQCLVLIMKVKKLGYTRMGNVLRIAKMDEISREEDEAVRRAEARKKVEPVKVRIFPISYAAAKDLEGQVKNFLSKERGAVSSDVRTNSLIVTDTEESLEKIGRMVQNLDTPPPQVMIEGKIVEATDSFQKSVGINWSAGGQAVKLGTNSKGAPVNMQPTLGFGQEASQSLAGFGLSIGTLDFLGDLTATLSLFELESKVKVLSSPRIVTMNNEPALIEQSTSVPQAQITTTATGQTKTYTKVDFKLALNVTPQITNDASIILKVNVNRDFAGSPVDPEDATSVPIFGRKAQTKVIVKNGQTTVIGGIYQNDTSEGENGLSGLKDIPVLGYLFRSRSLRREKNELLIFLTPRIVNNPVTTASAGANEKTM